MITRSIIGGAFAVAGLFGGGPVNAQVSHVPAGATASISQMAGPEPTPTGKSLSSELPEEPHSAPLADPWKCVDLWTDPSRPSLDETIDACRAALLRKFHNGYASPMFSNMGVFEIREGKFEAALADLDQAIAWNDRQSKMEALANRAVVHDHLGDHAAAKADREAIVNLHPHDAEDFVSLATAHDQLGQPQAAIAAYSAAIAKAPRITTSAYSAVYGRGRAYMEISQFELAVADFTTAVEMAPGAGQPLNDRCWARAAADRDLDAALTDCNQALQIATQRGVKAPNWLESRGFVYFRQGKFTDAIRDFDVALAIAPKRATTLYLRGMARSRNGELEEGAADISLAQTIDPQVAVTFASFGLTP